MLSSKAFDGMQHLILEARMHQLNINENLMNNAQCTTPIHLCINEAAKWFVEKSMQLNSRKTEAIAFDTKQKKPASTLTIDDDVIHDSSLVQLLGGTIANKLTFN